jgi:hypothetical protein
VQQDKVWADVSSDRQSSAICATWVPAPLAALANG